MKVVATNGSDVRNVRLVHWWPGRWWQDIIFGANPIPDRLARKATLSRSRYMTVASVDFGTSELSAWARCCPNDQPRRDVGRFIALLRLARTLKPLGYRLEKVA